MKQRVLVCGGRDYDDRDQLFRVLDAAHLANPIVCLIHGAAHGADALAADWALERDVLCNAYPADWNAHGRSAGPIRNKKMLDDGKPHMVIAFPGGKGTANMIQQAEAAGVPVVRVRRHALAITASQQERSMASFEDRNVFAVWASSMEKAVDAINITQTFDILHHVVPDAGGKGGLWLLFKADSRLRQQWLEVFPNATILPRK